MDFEDDPKFGSIFGTSNAHIVHVWRGRGLRPRQTLHSESESL